jgi:hypothetical protein
MQCKLSHSFQHVPFVIRSKTNSMPKSLLGTFHWCNVINITKIMTMLIETSSVIPVFERAD